MADQATQINLHQLLRAVVEKGASDLHITTATPPALRIDGALLLPVLQSQAREHAGNESQAKGQDQ